MHILEPCAGRDSDVGPPGPASRGTHGTPALIHLRERGGSGIQSPQMRVPRDSRTRLTAGAGLNLTTWSRMNPAQENKC